MNEPRSMSLFVQLAVLAFIALGFFLLLDHSDNRIVAAPRVATTTAQQAAAAETAATSTVPAKTSVTSSSNVRANTATATTSLNKATKSPSAQQSAPASGEIHRIEDPYSTPTLSSDEVNAAARGALVNILCMPRYSDPILSPISASGVLIDPRGVILTNAHVAQYVLLSESPRVNLSCVVRTGAPAATTWAAQVLYIPPVWVTEHASQLQDLHATGTGEHDYALLYVPAAAVPAPLPSTFPALAPDTRAAIAFPGDQVLVASYPAEFLGGLAATYALYPASSVTQIGRFLSFGTDSPDVLSLGGIIEAQSGSSGGAVVNPWGKLVGIIVTTSAGTTTAQRDLHALALSYIDSDLYAQSGEHLSDMLSGDLRAKTDEFTADTAPLLIKKYLSILSK